jgi:hypothetical protein
VRFRSLFTDTADSAVSVEEAWVVSSADGLRVDRFGTPCRIGGRKLDQLLEASSLFADSARVAVSVGAIWVVSTADGLLVHRYALSSHIGAVGLGGPYHRYRRLGGIGAGRLGKQSPTDSAESGVSVEAISAIWRELLLVHRFGRLARSPIPPAGRYRWRKSGQLRRYLVVRR